MSEHCPVCLSSRINQETVVDGYNFFGCKTCDTIFLDPHYLIEFDEGRPLRDYDANYWVNEDEAGRSRAYGAALCRVAETLLYARRPVKRFLDLGAGAGYLLDSLATYLPNSKSTFWGIERFPPANHSAHPNYIIGTTADLEGRFDAGVCIEVVEHLTPNQLKGFARELSQVCNPDAVFLINTGMPQFVRAESYTYLDPVRRGHIISYGLNAIERIFGPFGFVTHALPGKDWAYLIEYQPSAPQKGSMVDRIWTACPENLAILHDPTMGNLLYCAGVDAARAYGL